MRTARLKELVEEVLESLPRPHTEDVIEDVFCAIENDPRWRKEYADLEYHLGKPTLNAWAGFWVAHAEGRAAAEQQVEATKTTLIASYSKLATGKRTTSKKVKEPEALKIMSEYFFANKDTLPAEVRRHRMLIVELIKAGIEPAEAFSKALLKPAMVR